ncbi:hypothetical protein B857_03773 [Solibacillus isronensis B3W22]|uniref:Uncharacterized protein n=1 Tax=Solibacillus isronensis B3W22 TaxID=1224748 RepID=K1KXR4_9BACL|nr:hypothetical protein [Solibacillus isronensis]AMO84344.1 hypothetical protein SOLI23_01825 [Solibacillus silvestris]EKB43418.1 hypothetical protein B857_03773 [Solibacillus isronensis B3W22]
MEESQKNVPAKRVDLVTVKLFEKQIMVYWTGIVEIFHLKTFNKISHANLRDALNGYSYVGFFFLPFSLGSCLEL